MGLILLSCDRVEQMCGDICTKNTEKSGFANLCDKPLNTQVQKVIVLKTCEFFVGFFLSLD